MASGGLDTTAIRRALDARVRALLPGDELRFAAGTLVVGLVRSIVVLKVPTGNYVWVASGRAARPETLRAEVGLPPTTSRTGRTLTAPLSGSAAQRKAMALRSPATDETIALFTGVASDVTQGFTLPFDVTSSSLTDWRTFLEAARQGHAPDPVGSTRAYFLSVVASATPETTLSGRGGVETLSLLDEDFVVTPDLFSGRGARDWYAAVHELALALALLDARINYAVPVEAALYVQGAAVAAGALSSLRGELLALLGTVR
jgi:hypothetical protein